MKTGRVRRKATPPEPETKREEPAVPPPTPPPTGTAAKTPMPVALIIGVALAVLVCVAVFVALVAGKSNAEEWVKATRADGSWTTTVVVYEPQVAIEERWESDCAAAVGASVQAGTCVMRDTDAYNDTVVDEYEEYAYNLYYDETWDGLYEAQGSEFSVTALGGDDWWEENLHYVVEEELDRESCELTNYTLWVDDPDDKTQEVEVYLAECEVWDAVTVYERVYEQEPWCQCAVTTLVRASQQSEQGSGRDVRWPEPAVPAGGDAEQSFQGQVTFWGEDYSYTTRTDDPSRYQVLMTNQYYIGLSDGEPVTISTNPDE